MPQGSRPGSRVINVTAWAAGLGVPWRRVRRLIMDGELAIAVRRANRKDLSLLKQRLEDVS